jgi:hypothetical protein
MVNPGELVIRWLQDVNELILFDEEGRSTSGVEAAVR